MELCLKLFFLTIAFPAIDLEIKQHTIGLLSRGWFKSSFQSWNIVI